VGAGNFADEAFKRALPVSGEMKVAESWRSENPSSSVGFSSPTSL